MYVLKFKNECPELMMEHFYDESVVVRNGIALVNMEHNKNCLLGMNYDYVGVIEAESELPELLKSLEKPSLELTKETKTLDLEKVTFTPKVKVERKPLLDRVS